MALGMHRVLPFISVLEDHATPRESGGEGSDGSAQMQVDTESRASKAGLLLAPPPVKVKLFQLRPPKGSSHRASPLASHRRWAARAAASGGLGPVRQARQ